ncbi:hypothetical protein B0H17DRAFT_1125737 [Mycena rosella]|uniref:Uncharacterized protein n=1 Tax=Mycena rosella TaxID=1033263 RepID=A0AAD7M9I1_MYCRO|nr:hypothetical protein B0H17DRAFT_1302388 [Mycena rosella]KAJ7706934.1 hypothetical protein B0H17DRAFT_1125737 [Mycena rosella]
MAHYNFNAGQPPPGRYATASYLLGMGPLPPPTNRELAVAYTQAGLDSGMFAQPQFEEDYGAHNTDDENTHAQPPASGEPQIDPTLLALSSQGTANNLVVGINQRVPNIAVEVIDYAAKDKTKHMKIEVVIPADIPADDFFSRIHARMNVDPATAILGWKESQERRRDPHRRLETAEDLGGAFKQLIALQKSSRRKKPVIMEIANLEVQPDGKTTKQAEKQSETAISIPELEIVKAKLTCALHPGRNRWCYVMPPDSKHPGEHIALGIEHVGLWARKVHDGEASDDCINPPNVLNFDQMAEKGRAREERIARGRGQAALPPIHVHVGSGSEHTLHDINPNLPTSRTKRAREVSSDSSSDDDDDDALTITDVLQELDKKYPALQYLQYSPALAAKGIVYASSALGFDHAYYKDNVGMADGAIGAFVKRVGKMVRAAKKRNGKKQARTAALDSEKEN